MPPTVKNRASDDGLPTRWWGSASALVDDDEARRRLVAATERCILRGGTGRVRVEEVATEAGVSRSTVYRYFRTREELVLGVLLSRVDNAIGGLVKKLRQPNDAARSLADLILGAVRLVWDDEVNAALWSPESRAVVTNIDLTSEALLEHMYRHVGPPLRRWQKEGQLRSDLDVKETVRWMNAVALVMLSPPWSEMSPQAMRRFLDRYYVRALVVSPR